MTAKKGLSCNISATDVELNFEFHEYHLRSRSLIDSIVEVY